MLEGRIMLSTAATRKPTPVPAIADYAAVLTAPARPATLTWHPAAVLTTFTAAAAPANDWHSFAGPTPRQLRGTGGGGFFVSFSDQGNLGTHQSNYEGPTAAPVPGENPTQTSDEEVPG